MRTLWNEVFKPDSGIVFEIRAYGITAKDYDVLLPLLIRRYPAVYSEDGETRDLPDYSTITHRRNLVTTALELNIVGVRVRCWFSELDCCDSENACPPHGRECGCYATMVRRARNLLFRSTRSGVAPEIQRYRSPFSGDEMSDIEM